MVALANRRAAVKASTRVKAGDVYRVRIPRPKRELDGLASGAADVDLDILYEDRWILAVDKPAGIPVHPAGRLLDRTVITALKARCLESGTGHPEIIKLCHRLDLETSGVLLVSKDPVSMPRFAGQFERRTVKKEYLAIVHGEMREDAGELARNLGIRFEEIPINDLFQNYLKSLSPQFKGLDHDRTEENIQARIRSNLLMAMSNKFNALLLATGNKSELAVGYCTLYGDLAGGLAVISDIPKTLCYRLADHINKNDEIIPQRIISRPPSAELRPGQTDQDTLPPYELLDDILQAAVEENMGFDDIVELGHDPAVVSDVLNRLTFSEYRRRQAPPGLKITSRAGYDRNYPIARGLEIY